MKLFDYLSLRSPRDWLSSLPILLLLLLTISSETLEYTHAQLLKLGEFLWQDYYLLRVDPPEPSCDPNMNIEQALAKLRQEFEAESDEGGLDLFEDDPFNEVAARESLQARLTMCQAEFERAEENQSRITTGVRIFRYVEQAVAGGSLAIAERQSMVLLLLLFVAAVTCTLSRHHISFRPIESRLDYHVSTSAQLIGSLILTYSAWSYYQNVTASGVAIEQPEVIWLMILGFLMLVLVSIYQLLMPPDNLTKEGRWRHAVLTIPLYTYMALIAGNYFIFTEGHGGGVAIYVGQLLEQGKLFLKIGLYIWIGMLLKQTRLGELVFNVFAPWKCPPELLAFIAIVIMAVPTAYTGASGIIIIAMGVVVYQELRRVGARRQLALAATAMTGSAGVVLRPCLLVVLIAALNKEVVTDQLYGWGAKVFLLSALLFLMMTILTRKGTLTIAPWRYALQPSLRALIPLLPYVAIFFLVGGIYALLLNAYLDEFSAPIILPVIVLAVVAYEKLLDKSPGGNQEEKQIKGFERAVRVATTESTVHIGALIMLMGLSFATGGVIELSGIIEELPASFANIWVAMSLLLIVLVAIGMVMDPFGAVVLVTGSIASIAYNNGINPVHFWMITLVAFELGYLSPPVALNHLLTRQVVGEKEAYLASHEGDSFWYRHEKILLPLSVMGLALLIVAYLPLLFY